MDVERDQESFVADSRMLAPWSLDKGFGNG